MALWFYEQRLHGDRWGPRTSTEKPRLARKSSSDPVIRNIQDISGHEGFSLDDLAASFGIKEKPNV